MAIESDRPLVRRDGRRYLSIQRYLFIFSEVFEHSNTLINLSLVDLTYLDQRTFAFKEFEVVFIFFKDFKVKMETNETWQ